MKNWSRCANCTLNHRCIALRHAYLRPLVEQPRKYRNIAAPALRAATFSSNFARKKWRLEGNRETGEAVAEETKTAKLLMIQDFPITLEKFC